MTRGVTRIRYRFMGRVGNRYYWQSVLRLPNDSRVEEFDCDVDWFWGRRNHDRPTHR